MKTGRPNPSRINLPEAYLLLRAFVSFTVSTICVFGLCRTVETGVKRPVITGTLQKILSNKGFMQKREKFEEHTSLFLNKWFTKRIAWTEGDIKERGGHLAEKAVLIWPNPEV